MAYEPQKQVSEMMRLFGQESKYSPNMIETYKERLLAANLVGEESFEFIRALGFEPTVDNGNLVLTDQHPPDLIEAADAIGDILVVTYGAANRLGVNAQSIFKEVMRSNVTKIWPDGTVHKRPEDGKVIKPSTYSPADIKKVLESSQEEDGHSFILKTYPKVGQAVSRGLNPWKFMAVESCGEKYKFTYQMAEVFTTSSNPIAAHVSQCVTAVKVLCFLRGRINQYEDLAHYMNIKLDLAKEIYNLVNKVYPEIAPRDSKDIVEEKKAEPKPISQQSWGQQDTIRPSNKMGW